ncbi:MAG: hypothetical protein NDJ89_02030 [Oligoflexia bacterium]|nr:hypothetical protein [Oligoflexia bacterium]
MKKIYLILISAAVTLTAIPAFGAEKYVYASGSAPFEHHLFESLHDDNPVDAKLQAQIAARKNAKMAFEEYCKNSRDGVVTFVSAVIERDPSDRAQRTPCWKEWVDRENEKGIITCTARAKGSCKPKEGRDVRVSEKTEAPARIIEVKGERFLIDAQGAAHPIASGASAAN